MFRLRTLLDLRELTSGDEGQTVSQMLDSCLEVLSRQGMRPNFDGQWQSETKDLASDR